MKKGQVKIKAKIKKGGGFYYENKFWYSEAYQSLGKYARELLHCLITK